MSINIKVASIDDGADILNIYAPYVQSSNITFEYDVPSLEEMQQRIAQTLCQYPYQGCRHGAALEERKVEE